MVQEETICSSTKVFYRFMPVLDSRWDNIKILEDKRYVYVSCGENSVPPGTFWKFETDGIFYNNSQSDVFDAVAEGGIIEGVSKGANGIIICFGQNYSGKTVTATGLNNNFEDRGVALRILDEIFKIKDADAKLAKVSLDLKYVEMSRNRARNLLDDSEGYFDVLNIDGLKPLKVNNYHKAMQLIFKGETKKTFRRRDSYLSNMANTVLTFTITRKLYVTSNTTVGQLHVVDLSGADTEGHLSCQHKSGLEVGTGNLTKTQLGQLLYALRRNDGLDAMLKQRLNVTMYYLREALNDRSFLRFVGHIRGSNDDIGPALSMLRFGQAIRGLEPRKLFFNVVNDLETEMKLLTKELCLLKKEKHLNAMLNNEDIVANLCQDRYEYVQKLANDFIHDRCSDIVILSTADAVLAMQIFKDIYEKTEAERIALLEFTQQSTETQSGSKREGSIISKVSRRTNGVKHSSNSLASLNKPAKKSTSKKNTRNSKESKKEDILEANVSGQRSRHGSKLSRRRSSKRKSIDSSQALRSETSMNASVVPAPPQTLPARSEAWNSFITEDPEYALLKEELDGVEQSLHDVFEAYNTEAENLKEVNKLVNIRQEEIVKVNLLRDLERMNEEPMSTTNLQKKCLDNLRIAEERGVRQKEVLLKVQTELKLVIDCKAKLGVDIEKKFEEFCKSNYGILIPDLNSTSGANINLSDNVTMGVSDVHEKSDTLKETEFEVDQKTDEYNKLRRYMKKEYGKRLKQTKAHQKWIVYCMKK